jgi:hypothetical protein
MRNSAFIVAVGCLSTILAFGFFWNKTESSVASQAEHSAAITNEPRSLVNSTEPLTQVSITHPSPATGAALLNKKLLEARDLRVFVEEAKQRPQDGGNYFAKTLNVFCWDARQLIRTPSLKVINADESHKVASKRDAAMDKLRGLCSGFLDSEAEGKGYSYLMKSDVGKSDPIFMAERNILEAASTGDLSKRKQALLEMLNYPVPLVVIDAPLNEITTEAGWVFDGKVYGGKGDPVGAVNVQAAKFLAACKFGDDCSETDRMLLLPCARDGICAGDRFDYVAALLANDPNSSSDRYQEVIALSDKFANAIQQKNADAFLQP